MRGIRNPHGISVARHIGYCLGHHDSQANAELCLWRWQWLLALDDASWQSLEEHVADIWVKRNPGWAVLEQNQQRQLLDSLHQHMRTATGRANLQARAHQIGDAYEADDEILDAM